jgi:hypothetical protein
VTQAFDRGDDLIREIARYEVQAATEARSKLTDEHSAAFRWMIASLFALNGGAILAIMGSDRFGLNPNLPAFWVFFAGIVATFLAVIFSQVSDRGMIAHKHSWGLYWITVEFAGERDEALETKLKASEKLARRMAFAGRLQAIFAMLFFVLGAITAVVMEQKQEIDRLEARIHAQAGGTVPDVNDR